jgi:hypothetical protein
MNLSETEKARFIAGLVADIKLMRETKDDNEKLINLRIESEALYERLIQRRIEEERVNEPEKPELPGARRKTRETQPEDGIIGLSDVDLQSSREGSSSNASDISQGSSVASIADSIFSLATASSMSSIMNTYDAGDPFITILCKDRTLQPLYQETLAKVAIERLERNLRRLLKQFAADLRKEAENAVTWAVLPRTGYVSLPNLY